MNKQSNRAGFAGFILSIFSLSCFGFTSIIAFLLCLIGIRRKKYRLLSITGLVISIFGLLLLSAWTRPGFIPYPFSIAKYCLNAPPFWLSYQLFSIKEAQSQYWFFGGSGGALYYISNDEDKFKINDVISISEDNKWKLIEKRNIDKERILKFIDKYDSSGYQKTMREDKRDNELCYITMGLFPFWIQKDCIVLFFEIEDYMFKSAVVVSKDGSEMAVYYNGGR